MAFADVVEFSPSTWRIEKESAAVLHAQRIEDIVDYGFHFFVVFAFENGRADRTVEELVIEPCALPNVLSALEKYRIEFLCDLLFDFVHIGRLWFGE